MTSQQKDAVTNKIMIYITVAFAGTVVWYLSLIHISYELVFFYHFPNSFAGLFAHTILIV